MATDTTMTDDSAELSDGDTVPKLEVFGSPIERKVALDGVLAALFDEDGPPAGTHAADLAARIGRYSILQKLGEGGMGVVLLGYDDQLHREAAIKLIRANRSGPEAQQRMLREAQGLARLSHPNVVQVYEGGVHEGSAYIAMERVLGQTLGAWLETEPKPEPAEILAVFRAAGRGLAAAHAAGLIHRDFKPDNVMIADDGQVKVMDFGLARALAVQDQPGGEGASGEGAGAREAAPTPSPEPRSSVSASSSGLSQPLTRTGAILGTPAYMAPEQFASGQFDARSDQFSFCVALWEALHGARPFGGRNVVELSAAVTRGHIEPPAGDARIPARVERALRRGLAVDPHARWPSMDALLDALDHDPAPKRWAAAGLAAAALVGVSAVVAPYLATPPPAPATAPVCPDARALLEPWQPAQREAVLANLGGGGRDAQLGDKVVAAIDDYAAAWAAIHRDACEATHVRHEQSNELLDARMRCLDERSRELGAIVEVLGTRETPDPSRAIQVIAALVPVEVCSSHEYLDSQIPLPADPALAAEVRELSERALQVEAEIQFSAPARVPELERIAERSQTLGYEPLHAELLYRLGSVQATVGAAEDARVTLEEALLAALRTGQDRLAASIAMKLCYVIGYRLAEVDEGLRFAALARAWNHRFDAPPVIRARQVLDEVLVLMVSDEPEARARVEAGIDEVLDILDVDHRDGRLEGVEELPPRGAFIASVALNILAVLAYDDGDMHRARPLMLEVSHLRRQLLSPEHHQVQLMELNLAGVAMHVGDWVEAEDRLRSVYDGIRARGAGRFKDLYVLHVNLSDVLIDRVAVLGSSEAAEAEAELAVAFADCEPRRGHPLVSLYELDRNRGRLARLLGQLDEAEAAFDRAEASLEHEPKLLERAWIDIERGALARDRGQPRRALEHFDAASHRISEAPTIDPALRARLARARGETLLELGRTRDGLEALRGALALWDGIEPHGHPQTIPIHERLAELDIPEADDHRHQAELIRAKL